MSAAKPLLSRTAIFWLGVGVLFVALISLLSDALLPFLIGIAIAYLLNPICEMLHRRGFNRTAATTIILLIFVLMACLLILFITPIIADQVRQLAQATPGYVESIRAYIEPRLQEFMSTLTEEQSQKIREAAQRYAGNMAGALGTAAEGFWRGSQAIISFFSLLIITPIVAFYLLRDWHELVNRIDSWLPRAHVATIREQVREVDRTLSGFVRGQAMVCFLLGSYYSIALSIVGVNYGFIVGVIAGLLSFIPFVGSTFGLVVATALALVQFDSYTPAAIVIGIFMVAQFLEGNVIAPKFIGESVGLHPVWIIFALVAGGSLLGFTGMLLAVPVAAVIGVLTRFVLGRYMESSYYRSAPRKANVARRVRPL